MRPSLTPPPTPPLAGHGMTALAKTSALAVALVMVLAAGACSQAPPLKLPDVPLASQWREAPPDAGGEAGRTLAAADWWTLYGDAELDAFQQRLLVDSPDLAAALARHSQASAASDLLRASRYPTLGASLDLERNRQSERRPLRVLGPNSPNDYTSATLGLAFDYEIDLWGRVRNQVASGEAQRRAADADLAAARLSLQAELTDKLIVLRGLDRDIELLDEAEATYGRALDLVQRRHRGGVSSGLDLARAEAQLEAARSQQHQSRAQRALVEHAIAALLGQSPSTFAIAPKRSERPAGTITSTPKGKTAGRAGRAGGAGKTGRAEMAVTVAPEPTVPAIPLGLPSTLVQRRPDIVAAQQRVVAANASVGIARAAYFPALTLGATAGFQSSDVARLLGAPSLFWAVGPGLVANLFDGGRRRAEEARVGAVLEEAGARYRGVVLAAFQEVEDSLALLARYEAARQNEEAGFEAARRALVIATRRYQQGAASYLEVTTAQTAALQARRSAADLATRTRRASVQLVRALGGGWQPGREVAGALRD